MVPAAYLERTRVAQEVPRVRGTTHSLRAKVWAFSVLAPKVRRPVGIGRTLIDQLVSAVIVHPVPVVVAAALQVCRGRIRP